MKTSLFSSSRISIAKLSISSLAIANVALAMALAFSSAPLRGDTAAPTYMSDQAAARFLDQATWGPTPAGIAQLKTMGIPAWLNWQFSLYDSDLPDQPLLNAAGNNNTDLRPVQTAFIVNAITNDDQLRQRVAFALSQLWVVSQDTVTPAYAFPPYWRIFREQAFGSYRDVIRAVTLSPAMGRYLNMANNNKGNAAKGTSPNENYARELLQLFTLGLVQLNADGSLVVDAHGVPIPTYDQAIVTNMAKALTGWTYPTAPGATPKNNNPAYYAGDMFAVAANHDTSAKVIFGGVTIPAGQSAEQDLDSVIDAIMAQPTLAPFVSKQLIQHLVTSNPSPGYIARISAVFTNNGQGSSGDLQAVITAILTDPEARNGDDQPLDIAPTFGHLREPVLFVTSMLRGLNGNVTNTNTLYSRTANLGQDLFRAPSVFSYFSPQFRGEKGLSAPEFQIYSTQTAAFRNDYVYTTVYGTLDKGTTVNLAPFLDANSTLEHLLGVISDTFLHGAISANLYQAAYTAAAANKAPIDQVKAALYIVLTSTEYQVIH